MGSVSDDRVVTVKMFVDCNGHKVHGIRRSADRGL